MVEPKTSRPFQERFLDGFDRSQLRQEVRKVKPTRFAGMKKKYVTLALGTTLALGGLGVPLKRIENSQNALTQKAPDDAKSEAAKVQTDGNQGFTGDLKAAQNIAAQVAGGVAAAATGVQKGVESVAMAPLSTVAEAPKQLTVITESIKEQFFARNVPFGSIIYHEAKKNDLPPELVAAVVQQESKFKPTARSGAGAVGLMQLVPKTGRWLGARDLTNPVQNIQAGAKYLRYLHDRFDGNTEQAIAAYNAGEGNVRRFHGVPPFRETRDYVARVKSFQQAYASQVDSQTAELGGGTVAP